MHLRRVLLVTLFTLLATSSALVATQETSISLLEHLTVAGRKGVNKGRSLRLAKTSDEKASATIHDDPTDADERANLISKLFSEISDKIPLSWKTQWWLDQFKPVTYVQEKMGMKLLKGDELKSHKNYHRLVQYEKNLKENTIWMNIRRGVSTYDVWTEKKFNQVDGKSISEQLANIQKKTSFKDYRRYAVAFDTYNIDQFRSGYNRPTVFFDPKATLSEKMARAQIWAEEKIPNQYVKEFLGHMHAKDAVLVKKNDYYAFYLQKLAS